MLSVSVGDLLSERSHGAGNENVSISALLQERRRVASALVGFNPHRLRWPFPLPLMDWEGADHATGWKKCTAKKKKKHSEG